MKNCGILVILLFLLTACSAPPPAGAEVFFETDRIFSESADPQLILTDATPAEVLAELQKRYPVVEIDFQSDESLYVTLHTNPVQHLVVVPNDLSGDQPYLIMITRH